MKTTYVCNVQPTTNAFDYVPLVPPTLNYGRRKKRPVQQEQSECLIPPTLNYEGDYCDADEDCDEDNERCNDDNECECKEGEVCNCEAPLVPPTMPNFGMRK